MFSIARESHIRIAFYHYRTVLLLAMLISPLEPLVATRGPDDYGLIAGAAMMLFFLPSCLVLIAFVIFFASKLVARSMSGQGTGRRLCIISIVIAIAAILLAVFLIHLSGWNHKMIETMTIICIPVVGLTVIMLVLYVLLRNYTDR